MTFDLEVAKFTKNVDGTYSVIQPIDKDKMLKFPKVSIKIEVEAMEDDETGVLCQVIYLKKRDKIRILFRHYLNILKGRGS